MIYVDIPMRVSPNHPTAPRCFRGKMSAHLMADSEGELIRYAVQKLRMKKAWIQRPGTRWVHFDVTGNYLSAALADPQVKKLATHDLRDFYTERLEADGNP